MVSYYYNIKVQDYYFYSILNDLKSQESEAINLFGSVTNKLNFATFLTDINYKVLQTSYNHNYYDFTLKFWLKYTNRVLHNLVKVNFLRFSIIVIKYF